VEQQPPSSLLGEIGWDTKGERKETLAPLCVANNLNRAQQEPPAGKRTPCLRSNNAQNPEQEKRSQGGGNKKRRTSPRHRSGLTLEKSKARRPEGRKRKNPARTKKKCRQVAQRKGPNEKSAPGKDDELAEIGRRRALNAQKPRKTHKTRIHLVEKNKGRYTAARRK